MKFQLNYIESKGNKQCSSSLMICCLSLVPLLRAIGLHAEGAVEGSAAVSPDSTTSIPTLMLVAWPSKLTKHVSVRISSEKLCACKLYGRLKV